MDRILRAGEVAKLLSVTRASIYYRVKTGSFPKPLKLSARSVGWRKSTIDKWLEELEEIRTAEESF